MDNQIQSEDKVEERMVCKRKRPRVRDGCPARVRFGWDAAREGFVVYEFVEARSHGLHSTEHMHLHKSNKCMSDAQKKMAQANRDAGMSLSASYQLLADCAGGYQNLRFTKSDQKNHLNTKRQRTMARGEATYLLDYFEDQKDKHPGFFYAVEVDSEEKVANIFWVDSRMREDYALFGDSVSFDTTFRTNKYFCPLGMFVGFNHHRQTCVFGACLMYDETTPSFEWLFVAFSRCMKNKLSITIFTDQDAAMAAALRNEWPTVFHALCTWHILMNAKKHLRKDKAFWKKFQHHISFIFYDVDSEEEFDMAWSTMVSDCFPNSDIADGHQWLERLKKFRHRWCSLWLRDQFTAGMLTTQASESCNAQVRLFLKPRHDLDLFFIHFSSLLADKRRKETESEYNAKQSIPYIMLENSPILQHAAKIFTPNIFERIQKQYLVAESYIIKKLSDNRDDGMIGYLIYMMEDGERSDERVVLVDIYTTTLVCECRMFRTLGVLCRHMIKVMWLLGDFGEVSMRSIPDHYILKRWTLEARGREVVDVDGSVGPSAPNENDAGKGIAMRYRETTAMLNQLAMNMSMADEKDYNKWMGVLKKVCNEANKALSKTITSEDRRSVLITGLTLKEKSNPRSHGKERYQSTNEKERRRKKREYRKRMKSIEVVTPDDTAHSDGHLSDLDDNIAQWL
ncbi:unnamed protein product [Linum trigynum]